MITKLAPIIYHPVALFDHLLEYIVSIIFENKNRTSGLIKFVNNPLVKQAISYIIYFCHATYFVHLFLYTGHGGGI